MRIWVSACLLSLALLSGVLPADAQLKVTVKPITTGVTSDTTSAPVAVPNGPKSVSGFVTCSAGACTQTQAIYGTNLATSTVAQAALLCTITLSGTSTDFDACPVITAAFARFFVITTSTTGTAATGAVYVAY